MKKQLLNELDTMKYLFGYKAGKVISEQSSQSASGNNLKEFANFLLDVIQNNKTFFDSEFVPGKILVNPILNYKPSTGLGNISFTEYTPGVNKPPVVKEIQFSTPKGIENETDLFSNKDKIGLFSMKAVPSVMKYLDLTELMFVAGGDKNPQEFYDFLSRKDSKLINELKKSMEDHLSRVTFEIFDKDVLRKVYDTLFANKTK